MWVLEAHSKEITGLALSGQCPGLLVTTSSEGDLKVWDAQQNTIPRMIHERNMKMGIVHTLELCPNSPFIIASGGDNKSNNFTVLDLLLEDVGESILEKCKSFSLIIIFYSKTSIWNKRTSATGFRKRK